MRADSFDPATIFSSTNPRIFHLSAAQWEGEGRDNGIEEGGEEEA